VERNPHFHRLWKKNDDNRHHLQPKNRSGSRSFTGYSGVKFTFGLEAVRFFLVVELKQTRTNSFFLEAVRFHTGEISCMKTYSFKVTNPKK
jgi:hypothetical protein